MVDQLTLTFSNVSEYNSHIGDILETQKYGKVQSLTITETGNLLITTDQKQITLKPELETPGDKTDYEGAVDLLGASELDGLFALMAIMQETLKEMKKANLLSREMEQNLQASELQQSADKLREAGMIGAIMAGVGLGVAVVGAVISVVGAGIKASSKLKAMDADQALDANKQALKETQDAIKDVKDSLKDLKGPARDKALVKLVNLRAKEFRLKNEMPNLTENLKSLTWKSDITSSLVNSSDMLHEPIKKVVASLGDAWKIEIQAQGEEDKIQAEEHGFQKDKESEQLAAVRDMIKNVMDKLKTLIELKQQAASAVNQI